jgi:Spy/CpxP family protein refolding chaperone
MAWSSACASDFKRSRSAVSSLALRAAASASASAAASRRATSPTAAWACEVGMNNQGHGSGQRQGVDYSLGGWKGT